MQALIKQVGLAVLAAMIGVYIFVEMTGPRGVQALIQKRAQIEALQEQNAELERHNEARRDRIERLRQSREAQDLEIRRRFKLQRPNTVDFYLPPDEVPSTNDQP